MTEPAAPDPRPNRVACAPDYPGPHRRLVAVLASTAVCCVAAGPSFLVANALFSSRGARRMMLAGVFVYVVLYGAVAVSDWFWQRWRQPAFHSAVVAMIWTRVAMSIIVPAGVVVDCVCAVPTGLLVVSVLSDRSGEPSPTGILLWTVLHGLALSLVLLAIGRLAYSSARRNAPLHLEPICRACGYDLRASSGACPECGTRIPEEIAHLCGKAPQA